MSSSSRIAASCFFLICLFYLMGSPNHSNSGDLITAPTTTIRRSILRRILAEEHHFVPALDQNFHYVGRWMPTSNRLRWDAAFPGSYIDFIVRNMSITYISLNNAPSASESEESHDEVKFRLMTFKPFDDRDKAAAPISLTVLLCSGNVLQFASSENGLIAVELDTGFVQGDCPIRIIHDGGMSHEAGVFQFKGVWLPAGASLQPRAQADNEKATDSNTTMGSQSKLHAPYRRTVELLTDFSNHSSEEVAIYAAEWLVQVATQFDVDQVKISAQDHCLTEACSKATATEISVQDLFFRSGPARSTFFARAWNFHQYIPDVLILDLGIVDHKSFPRSSPKHDDHHELRDVHQSLESFTSAFVSAYVGLIQQIRRTAYPLHPSALDRYGFDGDGYTYNSAPSTLPIFVMRPLDGSFEHATLSVVEQMQKDGDRSVFWIDTSGWLSDVDYSYEDTHQRVRSLTAASHAKVASFMHAHLCHYLAPQPEQCPFLRRDSYIGSVYVPIEAELDKVIEESKIKKLTELFWAYK